MPPVVAASRRWALVSRRQAAHSSDVGFAPRSVARRVFAWPARGALAIMAITGRDAVPWMATRSIAAAARVEARTEPETLLTPPRRRRKAVGTSRTRIVGSASDRATNCTVQPNPASSSAIRSRVVARMTLMGGRSCTRRPVRIDRMSATSALPRRACQGIAPDSTRSRRRRPKTTSALASASTRAGRSAGSHDPSPSRNATARCACGHRWSARSAPVRQARP